MNTMAVSFQEILGGDLELLAIRAGRIVLILVVAFILARLVRRAVRRITARVAERQEKRRKIPLDDLDPRLGVLRDRLVDALPTAERRERAAQRARTLGSTIGGLFSVIIYTIAVLLCLAELELNLGPLLAGAGIVGVALGFGAQSLVRDFLSGIFIVIEDQYGVGDVVDVGEASGVVEEVTLRATTLRGLDGTMWHVPNGEIRRAGNKSQYWARVILDVPVAYDADIVAASALIKQTIDGVWLTREAGEILSEPEVWGVEDFGNDSIAIRLAVKTLPGKQWGVARDLRAQIKEAFDREGFEIPFPQRTVWLRQPATKGASPGLSDSTDIEPPSFGE